LVTPQNLDNYFLHVYKFRNLLKSVRVKRIPYTFGKTHTGVVKPTHVWVLPPWWLIPHMCEFYHTCVDFTTLVVKPTRVWALFIYLFIADNEQPIMTFQHCLLDIVIYIYAEICTINGLVVPASENLKSGPMEWVAPSSSYPKNMKHHVPMKLRCHDDLS
jgi:hypothetical protein